jgi:hypothetical protein
MEIIKHGKTYKDSQVKVCPVCECEFSYVKKDIKENWVRVTSEDSDLIYTYINCPECGKTIIIDDYRI